MKNLIVFAWLLLLAGCSATNTLSPLLVRSGVAAGVSYGVSKYPQAMPAVRIAGEAICSAANGTNLSPANVVAAIQAANPDISLEATLIVNGALVLYIGIWNSYGQDAVNNQPTLKLYLQATCDGISGGLKPATESVQSVNEWPLIRSK